MIHILQLLVLLPTLIVAADPVYGGTVLGTPSSDPAKAAADSDCANDPAYGTQYEAKMNAQGEYDQCVLKVPPPAPCIGGTLSSSPKDGSRVCCRPRGSTYSYDTVSQQGACCPAGQSFTFDSSANAGGCCAAGTAFKCSCQSTVDPSDCPGADGKTVKQADGRSYKIFCGKANSGTNFFNQPATDIKDCMAKCTAKPGCVSVNFATSSKTCYMRNYQQTDHVTPGPYISANAIDDPAPTCPGADGQTIFANNAKWKIYCSKSQPGNNYANQSGTSLSDCMAKCGAMSDCVSVQYAASSNWCYMRNYAQNDYSTVGDYSTAVKI